MKIASAINFTIPLALMVTLPLDSVGDVDGCAVSHYPPRRAPVEKHNDCYYLVKNNSHAYLNIVGFSTTSPSRRRHDVLNIRIM